MQLAPFQGFLELVDGPLLTLDVQKRHTG